MKLAITSSGDNLDSTIDTRFGRAEKFIIYDLEKDSFEVFDNQQNLNAAQGAGIQAAKNIINLGAKALITGNCGPKAFMTLKAANIKVFTTDAKIVKMAIEEYKEGKLSESVSANVEGHWA